MFDEFRSGVPLEAIYWKDLRPGLVFAGGFSINGYAPPELVGHPVLDSCLVKSLHENYRLNPEKRILVLGDEGDLPPEELSRALRSAESRLVSLGSLRREIRSRKALQPNPELPVWDSAWVERGALVWPYRDEAPSLFRDLSRDIGLAQVVSREVFSRFNLPPDKKVALHIAVDLSYSMKASGKDELARGAVGLFRDNITRVLPTAEVLVYAFSEQCRVVEGELSGKEVARGGTDFSSFARTALRRKREGVPNAILVFTDGLPDKRAEALRSLEELCDAGFFYTQIVFNLSDDRRSCVDPTECSTRDGYYESGPPEAARDMTEDEYREQEERFRGGFLELSAAARGCQLIIEADEALGLAAVEVFDRWYGGLAN